MKIIVILTALVSLISCEKQVRYSKYHNDVPAYSLKSDSEKKKVETRRNSCEEYVAKREEEMRYSKYHDEKQSEIQRQGSGDHRKSRSLTFEEVQSKRQYKKKINLPDTVQPVTMRW